MKEDIKKEMESEDFEDIQQLIDDLPEESKRFTDHILNIPRYVKYLLLHQGKSQNEIAQYLGKSEAEISKWLSGRQNLTLRTISKLEAALSTDIINPNIKKIIDGLRDSYERKSPVTSYRANNVINLFIFSDQGGGTRQPKPSSRSVSKEPITLSPSRYECLT